LVVLITLFIVWATIGFPEPRPASSLTENLPARWDDATREFDRRLKARFPLGSSAAAMAQELQRQGFEPAAWTGLDPVTQALRDESNFVCTIRARVEWRTDEAGLLRSISGRYHEEGCL
jgi:hypothetical protein